MLSNIHFHVQQAYIQNFIKNNPLVSEKNKFQFSYVNELEQRARNGLDLKYYLTLIY